MEPGFPGPLHVLAAATSWLCLFGGAACAAGLLMASFVSFVVWLPLVALALNNGEPLAPDAPSPVLTPNAKRALFVLWTATAWLAAAASRGDVERNRHRGEIVATTMAPVGLGAVEKTFELPQESPLQAPKLARLTDSATTATWFKDGRI